MQIIEDMQEHVVRISGALHVSEAAELRQALADWLPKQQILRLDLSAVGACDAASLQLLCSVRNSARLANKPFSVLGVSPAVADADRALGLGLCEATFSEVIRLQLDSVTRVPETADGN
jgi:anti-anti-sigma regulatory factor